MKRLNPEITAISPVLGLFANLGERGLIFHQTLFKVRFIVFLSWLLAFWKLLAERKFNDASCYSFCKDLKLVIFTSNF